MKYSTRCSVAIHCMLVIALYGREIRLTSERIAQSTGCNAATIRSIFQQLQQAGLILVRRGTGGAVLGRDPEEITLWDVYHAVQPQEDSGPLRIHANPYECCPVGRHIHEVLAEPYDQVAVAVRRQMQAYTLTSLLSRYQAICDAEEAEAASETVENEEKGC